MSQTTELKPCPFCGWTKIMVTYRYDKPVISCAECGANTDRMSSKLKAVTHWNTRALDTLQPDTSEAFQEWWEASYHINEDGHADYKRCWDAARGLQPVSGLVAALEDLIHQVEGLRAEELESFDLDQARQALALYREGGQTLEQRREALKASTPACLKDDPPKGED